MTTANGASGDRWAVGDAYEAFMGRWSRRLARAFVDWLGAEPGGHWLEVGCGTGALTAAIVAHCQPASVVACDPSPPFVEHARRAQPDAHVAFVVAGADALPRGVGGFDRIVAGLVLNFVPEPAAAIAAMRDRLRPGGVIAAYVWQYDGGIELLHHFWRAAVALDPGAAAVDEARRFAAWQPAHLTALFEAAGLVEIATATLAVATPFATFDDYWTPLLGGTGPAPSYVASLAPAQRERLKRRLRADLPRGVDGAIALVARAIAVRGARH